MAKRLLVKWRWEDDSEKAEFLGEQVTNTFGLERTGEELDTLFGKRLINSVTNATLSLDTLLPDYMTIKDFIDGVYTGRKMLLWIIFADEKDESSGKYPHGHYKGELQNFSLESTGGGESDEYRITIEPTITSNIKWGEDYLSLEEVAAIEGEYISTGEPEPAP